LRNAHASTPARQHASTPARQHASTPARQHASTEGGTFNAGAKVSSGRATTRAGRECKDGKTHVKPCPLWMHGLVGENNWIYRGFLTSCCTVSAATEINHALFSGNFSKLLTH